VVLTSGHFITWSKIGSAGVVLFMFADQCLYVNKSQKQPKYIHRIKQP